MTLAAILLGAVLSQRNEMSPGAMWITNPTGAISMAMTLKHTDVHAQIAGFGARVTVTQTFNNPSTTPIEAIYTFPLPDDAAVDKMRIHIGERTVIGEVKPRDEARHIYEAAKAAGQTAALLDQERPNIFTQSVANVMPGKQIEVQISYVEILKYADNQFEFHFPMVVGPRFLGGNVPDATKIAPPIVAPETRSGQSVSMAVDIDAGAPIQDIDSTLHKIIVTSPSPNIAHVELRKANEIPNRDFILHYRMATKSVQSAFVSSYDGTNGGQFALLLMPPERPAPSQISPREIIFVIDRSGSQQGFPIEKSKELTLKLMNTLRPGDTFNVISFGMDCTSLFPKPQPVSETTAAQAKAFIEPLVGSGGTNVRNGIIQALSAQNDTARTRIVLFNTDGYIGNENEVIKAIRANRGNARIFTFGIGNSVNRYIIDAMAKEGRGAAEYVTLADKADAAVARLTKRLETPVLVNVSATFSGAAVDSVTPSHIPDVFDESPIVLLGHYQTPGEATLVLRGDVGGHPWAKTLHLNLSVDRGEPAVPSLWARQRIEDIEREMLEAQVCGETQEVKAEDRIRDLAMTYQLVSSQTSFVAVEPKIVNIGGKPVQVHVPVEMADGVSYNGIFGPGPVNMGAPMNASVSSLSAAAAPAGGNFGRGRGGGMGGGGGFSSGLNIIGGQTAQGGLGGPGGAFSGSRSTIAQSIDAKVPEPKPEDKVAKPLLKATGEVTVQVSVRTLDDAVIKLLKVAGLKVDDKDSTLKVVFGRIDAKLLIKLAKIKEVERIDPIISSS
jgi:Ca-activated chloride channel family protein